MLKEKKKKGTIFREEDEEEVDEQKDFIEEMILREIIYEALKKRYQKQVKITKQLKLESIKIMKTNFGKLLEH